MEGDRGSAKRMEETAAKMAPESIAEVNQYLVEKSIPKRKRTTLGLYITAREAFGKWQANPAKIKIIDTRTRGEYVYVGHAPMAHNIPIQFLGTKWNLKKNTPYMQLNENFVSDVKSKFSKNDTILVMCRSGVRSALAVNTLAAAGFEKVYSIIDGFEGDKLKNPGSYNHGKRLVNGWKNSGVPWTYDFDAALIYLP